MSENGGGGNTKILSPSEIPCWQTLPALKLPRTDAQPGLWAVRCLQAGSHWIKALVGPRCGRHLGHADGTLGTYSGFLPVPSPESLVDAPSVALSNWFPGSEPRSRAPFRCRSTWCFDFQVDGPKLFLAFSLFIFTLDSMYLQR